MRTETDLHDAYTTLADHAPDGTRLVIPTGNAPATRRPRRTRSLVIVAAAVGIAVPLIVVAVTRQTDEPVAPAASRWAPMFGLDLPEGWHVDSRYLEPLRQRAVVYGADGQVCDVVVYHAGVFDPDRIPADRGKVTINGRQGFIVAMSDLVPDRTPGVVFPRQLVWRYDAGRWASSACSSRAGADRDKLLADELTTARAVTRRPEPLRFPLRISGLPSGWTVRSASRVFGPRMAPNPPEVALELRPSSSASTSPVPANPRPVSDPVVTVYFWPRAWPFQQPRGTRLTINGHSAWLWHEPPGATPQGMATAGILFLVDGTAIGVDASGWLVDVDATLRQIASALQFASDPADQSTWFDSVDALP